MPSTNPKPQITSQGSPATNTTKGAGAKTIVCINPTDEIAGRDLQSLIQGVGRPGVGFGDEE